MKITAIIPIKHHSSRVPGKNYRLMNGKPLYFHILNTLSNCDLVDQIVVDTDSELITEGIRKYFPHITIYPRPPELEGDNVSTNVLLVNVVEKLDLDADIFLHTHTTNPLLKSTTIGEAINTYLDNRDKHDSLFTVNKFHTRFYHPSGEPINHDPENLIPTQDLEPYYEENSCLYVVPRETLFKYKRRIGNKPLLYPISKLESQDIDWEEDFKLTEQVMKMGQPDNKIVLITGSSGGIGEAICCKFKQEGWIVVGIDINLPKHNYNDHFIQVDLLDKTFTDKIDLDKLDCLVNCAAMQLNSKLVDMKVDDWSNIMDCNARAIYLLSKKVHPLLKESKGNIVNISSVHAIATSESISAYAAAKGAVYVLTRAMALEFAHDDVRVNSVAPGATNTEMLRNSMMNRNPEKSLDEILKEMGKKHPLNRIGEPDEIAEAVYFLADNDKSSFITGHQLVVDGGVTCRLSTE